MGALQTLLSIELILDYINIPKINYYKRVS